MLNISHHSIRGKLDRSKYSVFEKLDEKTGSRFTLRLLFIASILAIFALFLPWTQNIRSLGSVTTLNPYDKPQTIQSLIDGRIENWFVLEGDTVRAGDTIIQITESKEAYLDPQLLQRTAEQIKAKRQAAYAYGTKASNLNQQFDATKANREVKLQQNTLKIAQQKVKLQSDSMELVATQIKLLNATNQYNRTDTLFRKGIKSLTELENKRFARQESQAKVTMLENKIAATRAEIANLEANKVAIENEFDQKLAKIRAERMSSLSQQYSAEGDMNKLQSEFNKYEVRAGAYYIKSPINGIITKTITSGIGHFIKAGEDLVSIIPSNYELAVEVYVRPVDMPLLRKGQDVRIQFDGWPAVVFSGWPENSYGTFAGQIFAIDNFISDNDKYRILVAPDKNAEPWPSQIRVGGGANALILLDEVRLYYEIWRQLNGFPPDFYQDQKSEKAKIKAPIRKLK